MEVIGLDIGHSAVKVATSQGRIIFPTAATKAINLPVPEAAAAAAIDTVTVNGGDAYFVGETALIHSTANLLDGLTDEWIETPEHLALLTAGYQRGLAATGEADAILVLGLPSRLHQRQYQRLSDLAAAHLQIPRHRVRVLPQPLAAYMAAMLDEQGQPTEGRDMTVERWGVIDIGYYTTDFGLVERGVWSSTFAKSAGGANLIAQALRDRLYETHGAQLRLRACEDILRAKATRIMGKVVNCADLVEECTQEYSRRLAETALQVFGDRFADLDGVLLAGGAAGLIHAHLRKEWPHAVTVPEPRFIIAEGMRRYGLLRADGA